MPSNRVILIDPSQIAVARDLDTSVAVDSSRYLDYDQVALRVVTRWDIGALNAEAVIDWTLL
jgi:HK97 family phage major capsid protein